MNLNEPAIVTKSMEKWTSNRKFNFHKKFLNEVTKMSLKIFFSTSINVYLYWPIHSTNYSQMIEKLLLQKQHMYT